jgi:integrase
MNPSAVVFPEEKLAQSVKSIMGAIQKRHGLMCIDSSATSSKSLSCRLRKARRFVPVPVSFLTVFPAQVQHCRTEAGHVVPMGTIIPRKRKDGSTGYTAQILLKREGKIVHREAKTFDRKQAASAWLDKREGELAKPGALERARVPQATLGDAIDRQIAESLKAMGKTKAQVLRTLKTFDIASMACEDVGSADIVSLARQLGKGREPQTVGNYLSHLASVFSIARAAWEYPLDPQGMEDALKVCRKLGLIAKSSSRERRPTLEELDRLMTHFVAIQKKRPSSMPMHKVAAFALFSTRRQAEIVRLARKDFEPQHSRVLVRDMKHPGEKIGNDQWCDLPEEAVKIAQSMPDGPLLFPFTEDAISAAFTRACAFLDIEGLTFHDLRHEGISRLFEMGYTIPKAAAVSGHRSWQSLKRYTHLRETGDKYAGWKWLEVVTR